MSPKPPSTPQLDFLFEAPPEPRPAVRKTRERRTWLVSQLVSEARELVEQEFGDIWVEGEISNCRPASSGHLYFTLKDTEAQLPVVLFRRQAQLLRFRPEDGLQVRVRGKLTIYEQRGQIQLVAETMEPVGAGSLQVAFEQLRDRLKAEGLFDQERKRPLPAFPQTVAIVTSPSGAVIRDFLNIVNRRHSSLHVLVVPVAVQGEAAPAEIESAIRQVNALPGIADVIVLARGGGSLEDLAAFNSERVARAIAASELPVVSAIGHETDFTIADFVSDLRAPTPSAAAELITEAQHKIADHLTAIDRRLDRAARFQLLQSRQRFAYLPVSHMQQRITALLRRLEQRRDDLAYRLESAMDTTLRQQQQAVAELRAAVLHHDPRRQLSIARQRLSGLQGRLDHALDRQLSIAQFRQRSAENRFYRAIQVHVSSRRAAHLALHGQLQSLSPLAVLQRGYALVRDENGSVVRSIANLSPGQTVTTVLGDGRFKSRVETIESTKRPDAGEQGSGKQKDQQKQS